MVKLLIFLIYCSCATFTQNEARSRTSWQSEKEFLDAVDKLKKAERQKYPYTKIYVPDPRILFDARYHSMDDLITSNVKWLEEIHYNPGQSKFIQKIINIPDTIPFIPYFGALQIDSTPYCWVMLFYNSDLQEKRKEIMELTEGLSEYYYERCGVSTVDLGYPSNSEIFEDLKDQKLPFILVKKPLTANVMFRPETLKIRPTGRKEGSFKINPVVKWAKLFPNDKLVEKPLEVFSEIVEIYENTSRNVKIAAILMEHYHEGDKIGLEGLLEDMIEVAKNYTSTTLEEKGYFMSYDLLDRADLSPAEIEAHDLKYTQKFAEEFQKVYQNESLINFGYLMQEALRFKYEENDKTVQHHVRHNLFPVKQPDPQKTFKKWIHQEL